MITRLTARWLNFRRRFSRSELTVRLLGLPTSKGTATTPGLVLIQIDGLSRNQLGAALDRGEMPFLKTLMDREGYRLHSIYAGLPSSTPAAQGELFYGVRGAVPAFSFQDHRSGEVFRMYDRHAAATVEADLSEKGASLLAGGAAYADIYGGGAAESHFCPSTLGWPSRRYSNPLALMILTLVHVRSVIRTTGLFLLEVVLALVDLVRGVSRGRSLVAELKFVPSRVAICIGLRELVTIGAKIDIARGLPIVHMNYLGYDEQAHRRGPSSRFAHWSLKGIDDAIARVWRAAHRSQRRLYDVWIYSDHGQEDTVSYRDVTGETIGEALSRLYDRHQATKGVTDTTSLGVEMQRARYLGSNAIEPFMPHEAPPSHAGPSDRRITVAAMGPIGLIYAAALADLERRNRLAEALVNEAQVPLAIARDGDGRAIAWTAEGRFALPEQGAQVLGEGHPFPEATTADLIALAHHPDAGDLVISGWRRGDTPITFAREQGSHAGPGAQEVHAFALLPSDAPITETPVRPLRLGNIRDAALAHLRRGPQTVRTAAPKADPPPARLRIMTYNVHSCIGMDGRRSPERVARLIARYHPDVVALQELDVGRARTGGIDQAEAIAQALSMTYHFHPTIHVEEERYGDAVLSHLPMRLVKAGMLPGLRHRPRLEPRGAVWVAVEVAGREVQVINTHLGLWPEERRHQIVALTGDGWLGHDDCREPIVLCGDFNAGPRSFTYRTATRTLRDAQTAAHGSAPANTWFSTRPTARIDHVFVSPSLAVESVEVPRMGLARSASDHLPVIVDLWLGAAGETPTGAREAA